MESTTAQGYLDLKRQVEDSLAQTASPAALPTSPVLPGPPTPDLQHGSTWKLTMLGFGVFFGYMATNIATIQEIYCGGIMIADGKIASFPTPIATLPLFAQILTYVVITAFTVTCAVRLTREEWTPGVVIFNLVPIIVVWRLVGFLIRKTGSARTILSCVTVVAGMYFAGDAILYFATSPIPLPKYSGDPMRYSVSLQAGLSLFCAGIVNLQALEREASASSELQCA